MPEVNIGNVVGLLKSQVAPTKKYVLWGKILNPSFPDLVELHYWDELAAAWVALLDPTHQYWLRPAISDTETAPPGAPANGDRYLIPSGATGAWSGKTDQIATWKAAESAWSFTIPLDGYIISIRTKANKLYDYQGIYGSGGSWNENDFEVPIAPGTYIPSTEKGQPLGVVPLDSSAKILASYLYVDTIPYNPTVVLNWPAGTDTIRKALDHLILASSVPEASEAEVQTGTISGKYVNPVNLKNKIQKRSLKTGNFAITAADNQTTIFVNSASAVTCTVDTLPADSWVQIVNKGVGTINFVAGAGMTLEGATSITGGTIKGGVIIYDTATLATIVASPPGISVAWGAITGTITDQADLVAYVAANSGGADATETVKGIAEISTQAESEDAASNTVIANIDHTRIVSGRGLRWFWEKIKTIPQTVVDWLVSNTNVILEQQFIASTTDYSFYLNNGFSGDSLPDNDVTFMFADDIDPLIIWHGTNGGGLWKVDFNTSITETFSGSSGNYTGDLLSNNTSQGIIANQEIFYVGSDVEGFIRFNTLTNVVTRYTPTSGNYLGDLLPAGVNVLNLKFEGDTLWGTTSAHGFFKYNLTSNTLTRYTNVSGNYTGDTINNLCRRLLILGDNVWVTSTSGLFRFNKVTFVSTVFSVSSSNYTGDTMLGNGLQYIVNDDDDLYISYSTGQGFIKFNSVTPNVINYTSTSNNYTGDIIPATIALFLYVFDQYLVFNASPGSFVFFELTTAKVTYKDLIFNYPNTLNGFSTLYHDALGNIWANDILFVSKSSGALGLSAVRVYPSDIKVYYSEDGLRYVTDPGTKLLPLSVSSVKYVDDKFTLPVKFPEYTTGALPEVLSNKGTIIMVTNESGGYTPAFSDGTNWRRTSDRAIIS